MNRTNISPLTILFSFIYLLIAAFFRRYEIDLSFINVATLSAIAVLWLIQVFLNNGLFKNKSRLIFSYGLAIGLVLIVSIYANSPIPIRQMFGS